MQIVEGLDESKIAALVDYFYSQVRTDPMLGPLFNKAISDWPAHLQKLAAFWSSAMLGTGRYKGQPLPAHLRHQADITPDMFARWLNLWETSARSCLAPGAAVTVIAKACRIAESLQMALFHLLPAQQKHQSEIPRTLPPQTQQYGLPAVVDHIRGMKSTRTSADHLTDDDYQTLAAIRAALRRFAYFSEGAAKSAGLTPQQHQALLAIRAAQGASMSIGELAEFLLIQPHSASELADRLSALGLVERQPGATDRRMTTLCLTKAAEQALLSLSVAHRDELRRLRPLLNELLTKLA